MNKKPFQNFSIIKENDKDEDKDIAILFYEYICTHHINDAILNKLKTIVGKLAIYIKFTFKEIKPHIFDLNYINSINTMYDTNKLNKMNYVHTFAEWLDVILSFINAGSKGVIVNIKLGKYKEIKHIIMNLNDKD